MSTRLFRPVATTLIVAGWAFTNLVPAVTSTLVLGRNAGLQFESSDAAAYQHAATVAFWSNLGLGTSGALLLIALVWWKAIRRAMLPTVAAAIGLAGFAAPRPALAYYQQKDYAEPYLIMPNESAFWVPDIGDNQASQRAFSSSDYLNKNKIATKRFMVPHTRLSNSGFWAWSDYYVPAGRLYIVDRSPYNQEWVSSATRGSSARDEGFQCQSSEGLDINVGITISAFVTEENAAKFLFHYGVTPPAGSRTDPEVIFTSVLYGRSLTDVMQTNVRNAVQAIVCRELAGRTLIQDNTEANTIMEAIRTDITAFLTDKGITLDFIGWADTFTFDPKVQDALNRAFIAAQDQKIATALASHTSVIQELAVAEALRNRWNGATPSSVSLTFMPEGLTGALGALLSGRK